MKGTLITDTFDYDGGRQVTVYVPPSQPEAFIFCTDGESICKWAPDVLEGTDLEIPPTMIIGVYGTTDEDNRRLKEYSPVFDAERFAAHEQFFVHDVRSWIESHFKVSLSPKSTAVYGAPAGAEFALAAGLKHQDVFGAVLGASPGAGYRPPDAETLAALKLRVYLTAGNHEPFFMENAQRWVTALEEAGADVVFKKRAGKHGGVFWKREFPRMAAWAFSTRSASN